jgi:hypothetical protein
MYIKEFLDSRDYCPICGSELEIKATSFALSVINVSLKNDILNIKSAYFDFDIYLIDNTILESNPAHFELNLSLFCPFHTSVESKFYEYKMNFDIYNGKIANDSITEKLLLEDYDIISDYSKNSMDVIFHKSARTTTLTLPCFDYSKMSLSRLREKIKTYILMS